MAAEVLTSNKVAADNVAGFPFNGKHASTLVRLISLLTALQNRPNCVDTLKVILRRAGSDDRALLIPVPHKALSVQMIGGQEATELNHAS